MEINRVRRGLGENMCINSWKPRKQIISRKQGGCQFSILKILQAREGIKSIC